MGLSFLVTYEPLWKVIIGLINKGIRLRFITKITHENTSYCNLLMKHSSEVFHDDRIKGNFSIVDGRKYIFYVLEGQEGKEGKGKEEEKQRQKPVILCKSYTMKLNHL
jgi:hypothetical protein